MIAVEVISAPAIVAGVLVSLAVIGKAIRWGYKAVNAVVESGEYIRNEMSFNGGSTLRDAIGRTEHAVADLSASFNTYADTANAERADLRERLVKIETKQEAQQ